MYNKDTKCSCSMNSLHHTFYFKLYRAKSCCIVNLFEDVNIVEFGKRKNEIFLQILKWISLKWIVIMSL